MPKNDIDIKVQSLNVVTQNHNSLRQNCAFLNNFVYGIMNTISFINSDKFWFSDQLHHQRGMCYIIITNVAKKCHTDLSEQKKGAHNIKCRTRTRQDKDKYSRPGQRGI